jgi:hypothetical protein
MTLKPFSCSLMISSLSTFRAFNIIDSVLHEIVEPNAVKNPALLFDLLSVLPVTPSLAEEDETTCARKSLP